MGGGWRGPTTGRYGQRMHDALEQLCDRILRTDTAVPDAGGTPATVIITLDLADLADKTGYAVASDGTLIPTEKALDLADQAEIYFAAVNAHGVPLHLGRTRRIASAGPDRRPDRPRPRLFIPRLRHRPGMDRAAPRHPLERGRNDGPGQPDPALSLPPPQLPQHRLGLPDQPRPATRMATTLVGRPRPQTDDQQPHPQRHGCCPQPPTAVDRSSGGKWPGWPGKPGFGISPTTAEGVGEAQQRG